MPRILWMVQLFSFLAICCLAFLGPIFTDEIHWLMQNARLIFDGDQMMNLYQACTSNASWLIPPLLQPGRWFTSLLHPDSLVNLRIIGMAKYFICIGLLSGLLHYLFENKLSKLHCLSAVSAVLSLGFLPSIMIFNRPESAIIIGVILLVIITLLIGRSQHSYHRLFWILAFLGLLSWFMGIHPKVQSFIPAILLLALFVTRKHLSTFIPRILFLLTIVMLLVSGVMLWRTHQQCDESKEVRKILREHTLISQNLNDVSYLFRHATRNISSSPNRFLPPLQINDHYLGLFSTYLDMTHEHQAFLLVVNTAIMTAVALIVLILIMSLLLGVFKNQSRVGVNQLPLLLPLALFLPVIFVCITKRNVWSFWEIGFLLSLTILVIILQISVFQWPQKNLTVVKMIFNFLIITSVASYFALYMGWSQYYFDSATPEHHRNGRSRIAFFQHFFDAPLRTERIKRAVEKCNLKVTSDTKHLVLDDFTYLSFYQTKQPYYGNYLFKVLPQGSVRQFLEKRESSGIISSCRITPPEIRDIAVEYQGICCLNLQ